MAGIGFQLRRLAQQDTISSIVASAGHAAMIAAGPWLFTIIALATITITTDRIAGLDTLASFRALVIYAFAVSLVFAAPVTIVVTRLVGDALWMKKPERIRPLLLAAFKVVLIPVGVGLLLVFAIFRLPGSDALVLSAMTFVVAAIWIAISICGAVRDYRGVTLSFVIGLFISLVGCIAAALIGQRAVGMAWAFTGGLTAVLFGLISRVFATFPHGVADAREGLRLITSGFRPYWSICLGAFLGTAGIWIDKCVFWFSLVGEPVANGLRHAPIYDSTMFIASLVLVPALASFVVKLETGFFERYQQYYAIIGSHGTLDQIDRARLRLARYTMDSFTLITITLVGLAAILMLMAPIIVDALALQYRQIAILRYGTLGTVFQFVFIASSSMLLFFDRRSLYLFVQTLYLVLNFGLALISIQLGEDYYGVGFFAAALIASGVAFLAADQTFQRLNFLTFIGNNPSVRGASARR
jgi:polysaccharide biosynthesis protein PelG